MGNKLEATMWYTLLWYNLILWLAIYVLSFFFESFACVAYKGRLFVKGVTHLFFSTDKKWRKLPDPANVARKRSKKIVFVRHGESAWNVVFNRGFGPSFIVRLFSAIAEELRLLPTMDSVFFDSPLASLGTQQAQELLKYVDTDPLLNGTEGRSIIVSSNLRRALSTGTIGFWNRVNRSNEKIKILSSLQEVTFNVDGVALAKPRTSPVLADTELAGIGVSRANFRSEKFYDASENMGDKVVRTKGISRMLDFCQWAFKQPEDTIIVNGHSLYFRFFFQNFLSHASKHEGKVNKMRNGSAIAFTLWEGDGAFVIDEESIDIKHGGFESKKKKI